jgi:hypothetical protein
MYSRSNSTTSPASGADNVSEPKLLQAWIVFEVLCVRVNVFMLSEWWRSQCSSAYVAAKIM